METKTTEAVNGGILKWEKIRDGEGKDDGPFNCPLCAEFRNETGVVGLCKNCPVMVKTGSYGCCNTPHAEWVSHQEEEHSSSPYKTVQCPTCKDLAQQEVDFLKSLLPSEEPKIEPQAGDVWEVKYPMDSSEYHMYVYREGEELTYMFADGSGGSMPVRLKMKEFRHATRIFSLQEHLEGEGK